MKKWMRRLFVVFGLLGVAYLAGLYLLQNYLMFFPDRYYVSSQDIGLADFKEITLTATDGNPSYKYVSQFTKPLLIIHGKQDMLIPYRHAEPLFERASASDKQLYVFDEHDHVTVCFDGANLPYILQFLKKF